MALKNKTQNASFIKNIADSTALVPKSNTSEITDTEDTQSGQLDQDETILDKNDEIVKNRENNTSVKPSPKKNGKTPKQQKEFIESLLKNYQDNNEKTKEKTSLHLTPELHYELKMLAFKSKVNLLDLTNAMVYAFIQENS